MKRVLIVSGSRADKGLLAWPAKVLREDPRFDVWEIDIHGSKLSEAVNTIPWDVIKPDVLLILGDRFEIMGVALDAHLHRVPIAHLCGGDVSKGSYDDAMRDCISRLASIHFPTSDHAASRLTAMGCSNVHMVGSTGVDYILHGPWRELGPPAIEKPYVLVAYYPETIDDTVDLKAVEEAIACRPAIWITPNKDRGSERIPGNWNFTHDQFLNVMVNCEEFIGNSSAILYEAPFLGVKTKLIGKRQLGRVVPFGDGKASERIRNVLAA